MCRTSASTRNFSVLMSGRSDFEIKIREDLCIKKFRPKLNTQAFQGGRSFVLNVF